MLSPCNVQVTVSFPGLTFCAIQINKYYCVIIINFLFLFYLPHNNTKRITNNIG